MSDTYVSSGVTSSGLVLNNGDTAYVYAGGTVISTTVNNGGSAIVSGGTASATTVSSGGQEIVSSGGVLTGGIIDGGTAVISGGALAAGVTVTDVGVLTVYASGTVSGGIVMSNGNIDILSGATASGITTSAGGYLKISAGGSSVDTTLSAGTQTIWAGGMASGTTVSNGGTENVFGTAYGTVVSYGGRDVVYAGGTDNGALIDGYGTTQSISAGSFASGTTLSQYGEEIIYASGSAAFTQVNSGGELVLSGGTATDTSIALGGAVLAGGFAYTSGMSASITGGELDLTSGGATLFSLAVDGDYAGDTVLVTADGSGTALLTVLCFYPGTHIATPDGETMVEALRAGDLVQTANGPMAVCWIGQNHVHTRFAEWNSVLPIRITAGALGGDLPLRDLLLSPGHALFLDGILVQAGALANGVSIYRERNVPAQFTYYHVELASHELLLAEGVAAESFVDHVDRMNFHNWDDRTAPEAPILEMPYPRAKSQRQLPASLKAHLAGRRSV